MFRHITRANSKECERYRTVLCTVGGCIHDCALAHILKFQLKHIKTLVLKQYKNDTPLGTSILCMVAL